MDGPEASHGDVLTLGSLRLPKIPCQIFQGRPGMMGYPYKNPTKRRQTFFSMK